MGEAGFRDGRQASADECGEEKVLSRSSFLGRAAAWAAGLSGVMLTGGAAVAANRAPKTGAAEPRAQTLVKRWDVITLGNLSRNRYWGEGDAKGLRPAICTTTLISGEGLRLLVDPSLEDGERMAAELDRRTGVKVSDVNVVFITHEHGDHHAGLKHFAGAEWLASAEVAAALNKTKRYTKPIEVVGKRIRDAIDVLPTPGHTPGSHSLRFDCDGISVVVAGDAVATRDFWSDRRAYYNATDPARAAKTMNELAKLAGAIVPGHDNYFMVSVHP